MGNSQSCHILPLTAVAHLHQVETGYIDKNTWLDWITSCPTLFTVPAPLLFWEDRPGFDCMLQLHMRERVDHDCAVLKCGQNQLCTLQCPTTGQSDTGCSGGPIRTAGCRILDGLAESNGSGHALG
uniref:Peptidase S1 domain-containing protein n=1 Tax=Astatotilapia calliptera TaxID=8154 RepID=A0AAX7U2R6_ASTCA